MSKEEYVLGTAIKITTILNRTATSVTIAIRTPSGVLAVNEASMSSETDEVYSYIYQSSNSNPEGEYIARITATDGSYNGVEEVTFYLRKQAWS